MNRLCFGLTILLVFMLCGSLAVAAEWGEIRQATHNLNVREKRTPSSEHVVTLTKGQKVKVDFEQDGWVAVFNLNETKRDERRAMGYANSKFLTPVGTPASASVAEAPKPEKTARGEMKNDVETAPPVQTEEVGDDPRRTPVKITSDRMVYDERKKVVSFVGNVVAVHGDLTLKSDTLSAYLATAKRTGFSADSIDRIVAEGNVRATKDTSEGTCGKLTYFVKRQLLKMEQDPVLSEGQNSLTGDVINFYVRENRSEVVSGQGKRVKAVFMTPENVKVP